MSYNKVNHGFLITGNILNDDTGETISVNNCIENVLVRKRFIEDSFPLYMVKLKTTQEVRDIIRDNNIHLYLRISYYNIDASQSPNEVDTSMVAEAGVIFDGTIRIYEKPFETTAAKVEEETDTGLSQVQTAPFFYFKLSGIPEELLQKNETVINDIFKNAELADVLVYELTNIDKTSNLHLQETVNKERYSDILIPPLSLVPALTYLDNQYEHFYKYDANLFIDRNNIYFYDPLSENMPTLNNIECNVLSTQATSDSENISVLFMDENDNLRISYRTMPSYQNTNKISTHILGSHTIYYYYDNNYNLVTRDKNNSEAYEKTRYLWEKLSDKSTEMFDKGVSLGLNFVNVNPDLFTPLTNIKLVSSEYKNFEGDFTIASLEYGFLTTDRVHFQDTISITTIKK